jgi:type I restriction enzyme S subunit
MDTRTNRFVLRDNDVLFNATNSPDLVGKTALFREIAEPVVFSNHFIRLRVDERQVDPGYVTRWMQWQRGRGVFSAIAQQWVNQAAVRTERLLRLGVLLPPLDEQRRIARVLGVAEGLRTSRRRSAMLTRRLLESRFIDLFGDPHVNPRGFPTGIVEDIIVSTDYGSSEKAAASGRIPVLRMGNLTIDGRIDLADLKYLDLAGNQVDRHLVRQGDVLFNRTNSAELVGKTAVYRELEPMAYAGYLIRVRMADGHSPEYLAAFMNSRYGKRVLRSMAKSIVGMANINARELRGVKIPIPPQALQRKFEKAVTAIKAQEKKLDVHLAHLDGLFASLQHRAFTGTL